MLFRHLFFWWKEIIKGFLSQFKAEFQNILRIVSQKLFFHNSSIRIVDKTAFRQLNNNETSFKSDEIPVSQTLISMFSLTGCSLLFLFICSCTQHLIRNLSSVTSDTTPEILNSLANLFFILSVFFPEPFGL